MSSPAKGDFSFSFPTNLIHAMASRKTPSKKSAKKIKSTNGCFIISTLLIILVVLSLAATFYFLFLRPGPALTVAPSKSSPAQPPAQTATVHTPEASRVATPPPSPPPEPAPKEDATAEPQPTPLSNPRLAIIIDDIGNTKTVAEQIIALDLPLSFSILPHTPHANHLASMAKARGHDILLHLPMEASDPKWHTGPGSLLLSMSKEEIQETINQDLDTPYRAIGINNHMGSKFSENPVAMRVFLSTIKAKSLFFVDSQTATNSVGYSIARDLGVKTAKRDIFLDNIQEPTKIQAQIGKAIALARKHGSAIAIGHPYPATLEALRTAQTRLRQEITLVPVRELVN
ncbi:MAG: divergent polysaccharide deacetylase family protein [Desulfobulbaceae bacterium]|nr:divergent polysaccharide deacetylase family protein [Desulfobulbaceae bacterium]